ncbi:hypothetical protein [Algisphaera agarilytica]|uniref:Uncharacterized protein n=1 Tax=Algisphaera agarilytica TaxID=1385975 RepID=A0A7X0LJN0_9BACT|nr:hypothetical protein [Algisphaera agarilytica]MBB6429540.1 hypothetical protein [Algisphaera agarilytica]
MDEVVVKASKKPRGVGLRGLVLGWSLWLLGSWVVLWAVGGWTVPALRVMVLSGLVGMMGVWPAVRLSQPTRTRRVASAGHEVLGGDWARACGWIAADWLALNLVFQAVIWPLQLAARWSTPQAVWLVVAVAGWSLLTGLVIAWGRGTNHPAARTWAMVVCVAVVVLEPILWWMGLMAAGPEVGVPEMRFSPLQAVWGVSAAGTEAQAQAAVAVHGFQIVTVAASAMVGWVVLWGLLALVMLRERATSRGAAAS